MPKSSEPTRESLWRFAESFQCARLDSNVMCKQQLSNVGVNHDGCA